MEPIATAKKGGKMITLDAVDASVGVLLSAILLVEMILSFLARK